MIGCSCLRVSGAVTAQAEANQDGWWQDLLVRPIWVMYQNMMHIWYWQFTTATIFAVLGLLTLAYAAARSAEFLNPIAHRYRTGGVVVLFLLLLLFLHLVGRARLGAQD